ncbi:hypothetical protein PSTG_12992 [Puccinia striiformis f. sp. tritici PST-78]|uniref:Uncharacterized protein n=1 Tax=Puccinia striiformis f. sp. tritici PST-78 TaxID=1165861 RepID=A0A0L0V370_9BASI|nr:hypothetical protein PSTG_12992 [Puccinia striiformis f. sp. tritici PST-78]
MRKRVPPYRQALEAHAHPTSIVNYPTTNKRSKIPPQTTACVESGCGKKVYRDSNGVKRMGVPLSDACFRKHQRMAQLNILVRTRPSDNQDPSAMALTASQNPQHQPVTQN